MSLKVWLPLNGNLKNFGASNAIITNSSATISTAGKIGSCYSFAKNAYLDINKETMQNFNNAISICFWIKINSWNTNLDTIFQAGKGGTAWTQYHIGILRNSANYLCWTLGNGSTASNANYQTDNITLGEWTHVVCTYNEGKWATYLNGVVSKSGTTSITPNFSNITSIKIGGLAENYKCDCLLNDFRIYDHCLSAAEVHEIAQGLILHYKLNDITNGIIDSSGYGHNGEIINSITTTTDTPRYNNCTHMSATNQKIKISNFPTEEFGNSYSFTWWAKISSATPMHWGFSDGIRLSGMYTGRLWYTNDSSNNPLYIPGTTTQVTAPSTGVWHHYAMIGDGTTCKVYLDGEFWAQAKNYKAINGTTIYINGWDTSTNYSSNNLSISDFRIYCTPLLDTDIKLLYNIGMKIDNLGQLHTFEFLEDDTEELTKNGILKTNELEEQNALLTKLKKEKGWLSSNFIEI